MDIDTMIGPTRLGRISRKRMLLVGTPTARAAWTNSRSRRAITSPRTSRARPSQPKMTSTKMRTQNRIVEVCSADRPPAGPNRASAMGTRARTKSRNGRLSRKSMTQVITLSVTPPR